MPLSWNIYFMMMMMVLVMVGGVLYWVFKYNWVIKENSLFFLKNNNWGWY